MIRTSLTAVLIPLLAMAPSLGQAEERLSWSGNLQLDKRFMVERDGIPQYPAYHTGFVKLDAIPSDGVEGRISWKMRFYDFPVQDSIRDLSDTNDTAPLDLLLWEAYGTIYDLGGLEGLDVRVGKQRIAWGKADKLNPTDNLNPDDFTDFFDFGAKVPSWAVKIDYPLIEDGLGLSLVFLPGLVPVSMPRFVEFPFGGGGANLAGGLPPGMAIAGQTDFVATPEHDLEHSMQAVKLGGTLFTVDWSLSYFHGYDDIPIPTDIRVRSESPTEATVATRMEYPEMQVIGADMAGELFTVGWWAEAAVFLPEEVHTTTTTPTGPTTTETKDTVALSDEPYVKYTLGLDYTFSWGTYVNLQYSHGFFTERGRDALHDYFVGRMEHKFMDDQLKVALGGMWETNQFEDVEDDYGLGVFPEITWKPYDNSELKIGYLAVFGEGESLFASMDDQDQAYMKLKISF